MWTANYHLMHGLNMFLLFRSRLWIRPVLWQILWSSRISVDRLLRQPKLPAIRWNLQVNWRFNYWWVRSFRNIWTIPRWKRIKMYFPNQWTASLLKLAVSDMCNLPLFSMRPFIITSTMSFANINQKLIFNSIRAQSPRHHSRNQMTWKHTRLTFKLQTRWRERAREKRCYK